MECRNVLFKVKKSYGRKLYFQRSCLALLVLCYLVYALYIYKTERIIDLLTVQFALDESSNSIKADQVST